MMIKRKYYLWGAGNVGKRALGYLAPLGILCGIIDEDPAKHGHVMHGFTVMGYDAAKRNLKDAGVIIAHFSPEGTEGILRRDGVPYFRLSDFITEWYWQRRGEHAAGFLDFPITTRCTLRCRDCMQYIPRRAKQDVPLEALKRDLDALFRNISFAGEISVIGGEPFLHGQLPDILEYIGGDYRACTGSLVITTNGTVIPDTRVLELCRELGVFISISDYSKALPHIEDSVEKFRETAAGAGVQVERKRWSWSAPGDFNADARRGLTGCALSHMQLSGGMLWRCTLMAAGCAAGLCGARGGADFYDLSAESGDMRGFLDIKKTHRTTQCGNCLYPQGIAVPAAVQS